MPIMRLKVVNYRAFPTSGLVLPETGSFDAGINVLVGPNSCGKTTIINAIRLLFGRDAATSQGHTTRNLTREGSGDPREDFHDAQKPLHLEAEYDWSADGLAGRVDLDCASPTADIVRRVNGNTVDRNKELPRLVGWLRDHVFSSGWPRIISKLESRAFEAPDSDPSKNHETNEEAYRRVWKEIRGNARAFFGFDPGEAPTRAKGEPERLHAIRRDSADGIFGLTLTDQNRHPLYENSDGLAHLLYLMMEIEKHRWCTTFLVEEPDVFLHPGLQRQFMKYVAHLAEGQHKHQFIISTHSPYMLDYAAEVASQGIAVPRIYRVSIEKGDLRLGVATPANSWNVLNALGHRPADVLHPNGVIWVEGPSDVLYIRTWLDLLAKENAEQIRWGLDAEVLWYGGALLARTTGEDRRFWDEASEEDTSKLQSLTTTNRNVVVIMDRDNYPNDSSTRRKKLIIDAVREPYQATWITDVTTNSIEDYVAPALRMELGIPTIRTPSKQAKIDAAEKYRMRVQNSMLRDVVAGETDILTKLGVVYSLIQRWRESPVR